MSERPRSTVCAVLLFQGALFYNELLGDVWQVGHRNPYIG